jgi:UDP-N-acetylglucosamine 1-carboxyvinyltransferase
MTALLTISEGRSIVNESVWEGRFKFVDELKKMGADIKVEGKLAVIDGIELLSGAEVCATDLRAGAAMVISGLVAEGYTTVTDINHIDRGYENIERKFNHLGANIKRVEDED